MMKGFGAWKNAGLREAAEVGREAFDEGFSERQDELFGQ